jgi:hypothetical protein
MPTFFVRPPEKSRLSFAGVPFGKKFNGSDALNLMAPYNVGLPDDALSGLEKFEAPDPAFWVEKGYAIVNVDNRGSFDSEGSCAVLGSQEGEDGHDVIECVAKEPWCSGSVGMAGNSHLAQSHEKGYVVLKNVVSEERALYYRQKMLDWLGSFDNGFDIQDRSTWTEENLPWSFKNGMYLNYRAAHEKYIWEARQEVGVLDAFAKIWGTDELISSYDTINITLPNAATMGGVTPWPHVDQAPERHGMQCI